MVHKCKASNPTPSQCFRYIASDTPDAEDCHMLFRKPRKRFLSEQIRRPLPCFPHRILLPCPYKSRTGCSARSASLLAEALGIAFNTGSIDILVYLAVIYNDQRRRLHNAVFIYNIQCLFRIYGFVIYIL